MTSNAVKPDSPPKLPVEELDTDFKRQYPPDAELGQELAENARVWHVYRDQATRHDDGLLSGWNNTIDVLLTFAGLFSAAVTAFVVESYQFLQPPGLDLGLALYSLAVNDTETLLSLATSQIHPSSPARWINGLWFTSLFFSLAAAFLCILVKQWLDEYTARTRASSQNPKHWTRRRTFYFRALDNWGVPVIISLLPLLLHTALFLFFAGMVVLLWSLNRPLAAWLSSLALPALCLYGVSLLVPVWNAACPFATPLARLVRELGTLSIHWALPLAVSISEHAAAAVFHMERSLLRRPLLGAVFPHPWSMHLWSAHSILHDVLGKTGFDQIMHLGSLRSGEDPNAKGSGIALTDRLDCDALCWLITSVSDTGAAAVAFQALGAAEPRSALAEQLIARGVTRTRPQHFVTSPSPAGPIEAARVLKSIILLRDFQPYFKQEGSLMYLIHDGWALHQQLEPAQAYPELNVLYRTLWLTPSSYSAIQAIPFRGYLHATSYTTIRDAGTNRELSPSLHPMCMLMSTIPSFGQSHMLLFLSHCDLSLVTSAQWEFLMPTLWGTDGPCPRHDFDLSHCSASCLAELITRLLLRNDLDSVVLKRLWEKACHHLPVLSDLPDFLRYITSETFLDCEYSKWALGKIQEHLDKSQSWVHTPTVNLDWITAWRYLAYPSEEFSGQLDIPSNLISSALASSADGHRVSPYPFKTTPPTGDVLRSVLHSSHDVRSRSIPSLWQLVIDKRLHGRNARFRALLQALARSLCSLSRSGNDCSQLIDAFFVDAVRFSLRMRLFYYDIHPETMFDEPDCDPESLSRHRTTILEICRHLMELRPSWWSEGLTAVLTSQFDQPFILSFAEELAAEALHLGPCTDCPLSDTSRTFDVSLRHFVLFPFSVFPLVEGEPVPA